MSQFTEDVKILTTSSPFENKAATEMSNLINHYSKEGYVIDGALSTTTIEFKVYLFQRMVKYALNLALQQVEELSGKAKELAAVNVEKKGDTYTRDEVINLLGLFDVIVYGGSSSVEDFNEFLTKNLK